MNVPYRLFYVSRNLEHAFADLVRYRKIGLRCRYLDYGMRASLCCRFDDAGAVCGLDAFVPVLDRVVVEGVDGLVDQWSRLR